MSFIFANELRDETTLYRFSKIFSVGEKATLTVRVCADSRYKLYVNGSFVIEGPCHGTMYARHYETIELTRYLKVGENIIFADVMHISSGVYISVYREGKAGLWIDGMLTDKNGKTEPFITDGSWCVGRFENRKLYSFPHFIPSVPPSEEMHGGDVLAPVPLSVGAPTHPETACFNEYGVREQYPLTPRPIPNILPTAAQPMMLISETPKQRDYDAGRYETATVSVCLRGTPGTKVRVIYAESKTFGKQDGRYIKKMRDAADGNIEGPFDTLYMTEDHIEFTTFRYRAFRFIRLDGDRPFEVMSMTFSPFYYPMGDEGRVSCSDTVFNRMWEVSRHTVMCCANETFMDCPHYEQQQYDMDSALEMLFMLRMTNDTKLAKKCISDLAASQLPDGMLQANYPSVVVQVIPSFSLFWIFMLRDYLRYSGDFVFVRSMMGTMEKVLSGFDCMLDERGLVGITNYWPFMDWAPEWGVTGVPNGGTEEPLTAHCLMYATALHFAAEICDAFGRRGLAEEYRRRADAENNAVNFFCFDENRQMYRNTPTRYDYSQHTALWAVLSGAVIGEKAKELLDRAMNEDISRCTFAMNYYLFRALSQTELYNRYAPAIFESWKKMLDEHCTTWCENPDLPRSECHGWSSTPIFELSGEILGVMPQANGFASALIRPRTSLCESAWGTVPTPHGCIEVKWEKKNGEVWLCVTNPSPENIRLTVCLGEHAVIQSKATAEYRYQEI